MDKKKGNHKKREDTQKREGCKVSSKTTKCKEAQNSQLIKRFGLREG
jgi:hypothetical protein